MDDVLARLTREEIIRMKVIVMDEDLDGAIDLPRELLQRAESAQNPGLKNHLDK